ncbi:uncharacterized protein N7459_005003 [Penicillium hispanicum]|uniref:uncharacterized protein n=1 Tax=Penicillium hispanicum TaxID=1080232 RepID=UPI0025401DEC|nr:uncharacterized protein N7459_005003 [Penicillium hispanicum]KAJ5585203.1 hypothetical protein N7459_005003 [Penicillium hispanicum]
MPTMAEEAIRSISALATQLGNQISVQMLNYLSTTQDLPDGFHDLSHTFLDTCRTLWAIEAGLTELAAANRALPAVILDEVEKKFITAYRDFQHLEKAISKLIQFEHRGTLGKLQRGLHRPGQELGRIRESLKKTTETLQISVMAFHWTLGEARPEESVGIGYASLAAALERIAKGRSVMGVNKAQSLEQVRTAPSIQKQPSISVQSASPAPSVPPKESSSLLGTPRYVPSENHSQSNHTRIPDNISDTMSSTLSLNSFLLSQSDREIDTPPSIEHASQHRRQNRRSSEALGPEFRNHTDREIGLAGKPTLPTADPQLRMVNRTNSGVRPSIKSTLPSAIRGQNHTIVEQLLNSGVSPDKGEDFHPLNETVSQRDIEGMRLLLAFGANPNIPDSPGKTPLLLAVEESFVDGATLLLKHGADANYRAKPELESPLSWSIANGKINLTQSLLAHGGNPNDETRNGSTVLIRVIRKRAPEQLTKILLEAGSDPNRKDNQGKTALCEAVQSDQPAAVATLLDHGANPNLPGPEHALWSAVYRPDCLRVLLARGADIRKTPGIMEQATSINSLEAVRILLEAGIDPNCKKDGTYTPLCSAIRDDRADIVDLLLAHGADPNLMASEYPAWKCITHDRLHFLPDLVAAGADLHRPPGITEMAVQVNRPEGLRWLVEKGGANPNDRNSHGHTALTTAIREQRLELVTWLLAHGADPNLRGQDWPVYMAAQSPALLELLLPSITDLAGHKGVMEKAVQANQLESIKLLLAAGANVEWKNGGVFSPLTTALRERHSDIVRFLLNEGGADPNAPGEHLPIVKAIRRCDDGDFSMIELLLDKGADPNKTYRGWSAIMQAIEDRDLRLLRLLIEKGGRVDLAQRDEETGRSILDMADAAGWSEGTQLLRENALASD